MCVRVSMYLSGAACLRYCTDPDVTWGSGRGCPLVVHYCADLQLGHGLRCYGNITRTRNVSEYMLVLALCLVKMVMTSESYLFFFTPQKIASAVHAIVILSVRHTCAVCERAEYIVRIFYCLVVPSF